MDLNVLLVDDDTALGSALVRRLRDSPYRVATASSGEEALAAMRLHPADLVISDEQMPGMSGIELLGAIAAEWPATVSIMMTGHATAGTLVHAVNSGHIVHCLLKPCQAEAVDAAIRAGLAWKLRRDRCEAMLPLYRRQRDLLAAVNRARPGLLRLLERQPDADVEPTALYRRAKP